MTAQALQRRLTSKGLRLADGLPYERWVEIGHELARMAEATAWAIGDWVFYGEHEYGAKYKDALEATGLDYGTLRNYSSVAGRWDTSRRRDSLSFQHHATVAALVPAKQDEWLDRAEQEGWSLHELRDAVREDARPSPTEDSRDSGDPGDPGADQPTLEQVRLTVPAERAQAWYAAAERAGRPFADWAADTLDKAAA